MLNRKEQRLRRAKQTRVRIGIQGTARLAVFRSNLHIYANIISGDGSKIVASASTAEGDLKAALAGAQGGSVAAAALRNTSIKVNHG
jgi:large subunit ribosomal protein L18